MGLLTVIDKTLNRRIKYLSSNEKSFPTMVYTYDISSLEYLI